MVREPQSEESRRSLETLSRAVLVLWWVSEARLDCFVQVIGEEVLLELCCDGSFQ